LEGLVVCGATVYQTWKGPRGTTQEASKAIGATNIGKLGALGVGFMVLGFVLCYVIWARPKNTLWVDFGYPTDNPRVEGNILIRARPTSDWIRI
jgi:hypothetical protein